MPNPASPGLECSDGGESAQFPKPRSNSYNFVPVNDVARSSHAPCPLVQAPAETEPERGIYLRLRDRMRRFETRTRDFSTAELRYTKDQLAQIYVDVSRKRFLNDFAADLRLLRPSAECGPCPRERHCAGAWEAVRNNPFSTDDQQLRGLLRTLTGRVLDVGCGDGRYLSALEPAAASGKLDYLGVDPDRESVAALRHQHPWATGVTGTLKALAAPHTKDPFDHILLLRSFNHLASPRPVAALLASWLRPGGSLTVMDNEAFGLLRSSEQAERAEAVPAKFEHFRNDGAEAASRAFVGLGLTLQFRRDVGPTTSNQWVLQYTRDTQP